MKSIKTPKCPHCNQLAKLVTGEVIYPHRPDLHDRHFYMCKECDAYVGCHRGTKYPLGQLANKKLRSLRMEAHEAFDEIWKGRMSRSEGYKWLAFHMSMSATECHIGKMGVKNCWKVIKICCEKVNDETIKIP